MNQDQLVKKIKYSLDEGYTQDEIRNVLRSQGASDSDITQAFNQINNQSNNQRQNNQKSQNQRQNTVQNQSDPANRGQFGGNGNNNQQEGFQNQSPQKNQQLGNQDQAQNSQNQSFTQNTQNTRGNPGGSIPGLDLTDSFYKIKQSFILRRYSVFDQNNEKVLKARNKILSIKTKIPFKIPGEEEHLFKVESERLFNISNNYNLEKQDGSKLAVIDRKRTIFNQVWRVRDPQDNSIAAKIKTASQAVMAVRILGSRIPLLGILTSIIPHTYEIEDNNGQKIGELEGEVSIRDKYDLKLQDSGDLDRESMVAAVISIDAIEGQ